MLLQKPGKEGFFSSVNYLYPWQLFFVGEWVLFEELQKRLGWQKKQKQKSLAVFIDGPNILRKELQIDLKDIKKVLQRYGQIKVGKVFLNQFASEKLVEAVVNQGFESVITVGDIDVAMAVEATEAVFNPTIQSIAFVSRDSDFWPAIIKAKRYGKDTIVVIAQEASAAALKNTADHVVVIGKKE